MRCLGPLTLDGCQEIQGAGEPISVRRNNSLEALRVDDWFDAGGVVALQVVVELDAARLFSCDHDVADLEENAFDLRVVMVPSSGALYGARALEGLQDHEELSDQLFALRHQILLVQVNAHVAIKNFEANEIGRLLLIEVLREYVGSLGVSLTPLFSLSVEEIEANDALSELIHD